MVQDAHSHRAMLSHADRWIDRGVLRGYSENSGVLGVLTLIDGSTAAYRTHVQAPMLRPVLAAGRSRRRSMRIIDTIPITPATRYRALPVLEYRGNIMALQATHPTSRCCRCLVESAGTQQLCRCPPAHTCTCACVHARIHERNIGACRSLGPRNTPLVARISSADA